jgi:alpha-ketoglutarate-dependent taurine dioxygenase
MIDYLDLSEAAGGTGLYRPDADGRAWWAADVDPERCFLHLDAACLDEVAAMAARMASRDPPVPSSAPERFEMPRLRRVMARAKGLLDTAPGVALIDALPLEALDEDEATAVFWVLGQLLGRPVAQKWDGSLCYHVRDTGQAYGYGVRGSYTNVELPFHMDNAFGRALPETVGLLCLWPALEGGVSRFCSLYALHQRMLEDHPRLLDRLYRPLLWDRQAEHAKGDPKVARAPMFASDGRRLHARVNTSLVRKGYEVAGAALDEEAAAALAALDAIAAEPGLWIEQALERGQMQYLNNRDIVHYRSAFTDHPDPARRRHLIRTWHRDWGQPGYDG